MSSLPSGPPVHVLVLTTTLPAVPGDGTPAFVFDLASSLTDRFHVTIIAPMVRGARRREVVQGVDIRRFRYLPLPVEDIARDAIVPTIRKRPWRAVEIPFLVAGMLVSCSWFVVRRRPSVINAHWIIPAGLVARLASSWFGVPYVLTVHGADAYALKRFPWPSLKRRALSGAASVAAVSRDICDVVSGGASDPRFVVVPMGVDVGLIETATSSPQRVDGALLFVGRLAEKKGVDVLLHALVELPRCRLTVIGDGPDRPSLEQLARKVGVVERVRFVGKQPRQEVFAEMRKTNLLVLPSKRAGDGDLDGTPVVLAEGMAAGLPVVASSVGGIAEQVEDGVTGVLVAPGEPLALAAAIDRVLGSRDLQRALGRAARAHAEEALSTASMRRRYESLFDGATASSGAGTQR